MASCARFAAISSLRVVGNVRIECESMAMPVTEPNVSKNNAKSTSMSVKPSNRMPRGAYGALCLKDEFIRMPLRRQLACCGAICRIYFRCGGAQTIAEIGAARIVSHVICIAGLACGVVIVGNPIGEAIVWRAVFYFISRIIE